MIISIGRKLTCNLVLILNPDQPFAMTYSQWEYGLLSYRGWAPLEYDMAQNRPKLQFCMCRSRGGIWGPDPPRKSQVIWVSLNIMIRTPPPWKKLDPPGKCQTPSGSLEKYSFLCNKTIAPPL